MVLGGFRSFLVLVLTSGLYSVALPVTQIRFTQMSRDCIIVTPEMESCAE